MARKVLGQSTPLAATNTDLYTVPSGKVATGSTVSVCNTNATSVTYRVSVRPAGATLAIQHYVLYEVSLTGNTSHFYTIGLSLAATDVVTVRASATNVAFNLFGDES